MSRFPRKRKHDSDTDGGNLEEKSETHVVDLEDGTKVEQLRIPSLASTMSQFEEDSLLMDEAILCSSTWTLRKDKESMVDGQQTTTDNVPDMLLIEVFQYISAPELQKYISRVCKQWRDLSQSKILRKNVFIDSTPSHVELSLPMLPDKQYSEICTAWNKFLSAETDRLCVKIPLRLTDPAVVYGSSGGRIVLPLLRIKDRREEQVLRFFMLWDFKVTPNVETFWKSEALAGKQVVLGDREMAFDHLECLFGHQVVVEMKSRDILFARIRMKVSGEDLFLLYSVPKTDA